MGKYTEPALVIDKRYETLNKGLSDLYGNVAKNAELIRKREATKKQNSAKRMSEWSKVYSKGTEDSYQDALNFTSAMPNDNDNMKKFSADLKSIYKQGYDNIAEMVNQGASETDIAAYVQDQINAANTFTEGIVAFDAFQNQYNKGVQNIGKQSGNRAGNKTGDIVVGSQFQNIFSALGVDPTTEGAIGFDNLKMTGNLKDGIKFFYDVGDDGSGGPDGIAQDGEVLDFNMLAKNYANGENPYFKQVEDFTEITKQYKSQLDNLEKAPDFVKEYSYEDDNGQIQKSKYVNRKARQDYFMDPNTDGGKLVEEMLRSKDLTQLAQSVYGYEFAAKFDPQDEVAMKMLKYGLVEKLGSSMYPGETKLGGGGTGGNTVTTRKTYEDPDPEIEVIENFAKPIRTDITDYATSGRQQSAIDDLNNKYVGRPIAVSDANSAITKGLVTSVDIYTGGANTGQEILIKYQPSGNSTEQEIKIDTTDPKDIELLNSYLVQGNFPKAERSRIDGVVGSLASGKRYDDRVNKTTITTKNKKGGMTIDEFNEAIEGSNELVNTDDLLTSYLNNWQPSASPSQPGVPPVTVSSNVGPANFNTSNFVINQSGGIAPAQGADPNSTSSVILGIMNDEATIGASGGGGVTNFGFTGTTSATSTKGKWLLENAFEPAMNDLKSKYPGLSDKQYQAMAAEQSIEKYIIGKDAPEMGAKADGNTTIMSDLDISYDEFEALPVDLRKTLIDYKLNSGRSSKDLIAVALGKETGEDAYLDTKVGEVNTLIKDLEYDAATLAKLTPAKLEEARNDMYLGPIKVISETLVSNPSGDAKIGNKTLSYADRVKAADDRWKAWTTSQGKRGGNTGDKGKYGVIAKLNKKPSLSVKANNFSDIIKNNSLPTAAEFDVTYKAAKSGDYLINTKGELKQKQ